MITLAVTIDRYRPRCSERAAGVSDGTATKTLLSQPQFLDLLFDKRAIAGTDLAFEQYKV